jgi:four helix bundle protein
MSQPFTYKNLEAWSLGMDLAEQCYRNTAGFPREERYGLAGQLQRAAASIPSNVAEGHCLRSTRAYRRHVRIALGSHGELETCIELSRRLKFLKEGEADALIKLAGSVGRVLSGLHRALSLKIRNAKRRNPSAPMP